MKNRQLLAAMKYLAKMIPEKYKLEHHGTFVIFFQKEVTYCYQDSHIDEFWVAKQRVEIA